MNRLFKSSVSVYLFTVFFVSGVFAQGNYLDKTIVFKLKPQLSTGSTAEGINIASLKKVLNQLGVKSLNKMFPSHTPLGLLKSHVGEEYVDLSLIYRFEYTADISVEKAVSLIYKDGHVVYADPIYIPKINYVPNDTELVSKQFQLAQINALNAWDIEKGDTNVVIGIVDNGCQWNHPDLAANVKINYADPINGIDDDGDGYVDNYHGWDLGNNDNDPNSDGEGELAHGTHVAGDADAVTDNITGIASPAFKCKFLPVKISNLAGVLTKGFEGIVYAADHGCSIINCSWGDVYSSGFEQDIINYATINKNALVIAAAGNDGSDELFYPASYDHVLSVANVGSNDVKANSSNYSYRVNVSAPGQNIYSTTFDSLYTYLSGTSMASPIAAGAAALIKSHFPSYTAEQVGERLRVSCDNIDLLPGNAAYQNKLGKGRINMAAALAPNAISVRYSALSATDNNDNLFVTGDTIRITARFTNFLDPVSNLTVSLSSPSPYVQIIQPAFNAGSLATLDTISNYSSAFEAIVLAGAPVNSTVGFEFIYSGADYADDQWFDEKLNADYINVTVNDINTTITSDGRIGYTQQSDGLGFAYLDSNLLYEAGVMIGVSPDRVSDKVRSPSGEDNDFASVTAVRKTIPAVVSDFDGYGQFNDVPAASNSLNVLVTHHCYAWATAPDRKYIIVEYQIQNSGTSSLNNLYAGIFADWDIQNPDHNRVLFDASRRMGISFNTDPGGLYAGIKLLSAGNVTHYAIDNIPGGGGGVDIYSSGYTTGEKYQTLSTNRLNAGVAGQGNDVCDVVSTGPFLLVQGDVVRVAFALLADSTFAGLQQSADSAQAKYLTVPESPIATAFNLLNNYPNPAGKITTIHFALAASTHALMEIYNSLGQKVAVPVNETLSQGNHEVKLDVSRWSDGIYIFRFYINGYSETHKMVVAH